MATMSVPAAAGTAEISRLLTVQEVAEILSISRSKAYMLVMSGAIPSILIGQNSRRILPDALQAYISTCVSGDPLNEGIS